MKAICFQQPTQIETVDIDPPSSPGPGQALVQTHCMGICGTDYSGYLGKMPFFKYPRIPGHELGVEVLEVGDDVDNVKPGDRCSVEPYMNCGSCFACRKGQSNCCANLEVIGVMIDGGLCERFLVRANKLHPSNQLSLEQLALVETLAIGCHATDRGQPVKDESVLIIGAGPIGLASIEFTRLAKPKITVMDRIESRLEFCQNNYGVAHTVRHVGDGSELESMRSATDGDLYSLVIDATGNPGSMSKAIEYLAPTGRLVYVGITTEEIVFRHPVLHRPEASLLASRNALPRDFRKIIGLIEEGTVNTDPWISERIEFDQVMSRFDSLARNQSDLIKAVIQVS